MSNQPLSPLSENEMKDATNELMATEFVEKFTKRCTINPQDPPLQGQVYCMHSFIPMPEAKPDKNGLFGVMKCRGTFDTRQDADRRAEDLIRHVDSYHAIQTTYVGKPFPVCLDPKRFARDTKEVTLKNMMNAAIKENLKKESMEEKKEKEDLLNREQTLKEDVSKDMDPEERYAELSVKLAHLTYTYIETKRKLNDIKESILNSRKELEDMDDESSEYKESYMERIRQARESAGIKDGMEDSFMKFMNRDISKEELGF